MTQAPLPPSEADVAIHRVCGPGVPLLRHTWRASMPEEAWEKVLADLGGAAQALLSSPPDPAVWVDAQLLLRIAVAMRGQSPRGLAHLQGLMTAEQMAADKEAVPFPDVESLLTQFHQFWPLYFDGGRAMGVQTGTTEGRIVIRAAFPERWLFDFLEAWLRQILRAFGHATAQVAYVPPPEDKPSYHTYDLRWG